MTIIRSRYRKLLWILGIVGVLLFAAQFQMRQHAKAKEIVEVAEIVELLKCYALQNNGNIPESWDELAKNGFGKYSGDSFMVKDELVGPFDIIIKDVNKYKIAFGMRPEFITIEGETVIDSEGKPILLIAPTGKTRIGEDSYRRYSLRLAHVMLNTYEKEVDAVE